MKVTLKVFMFVFSIVIILMGSHALAFVKQDNLSVEERGDLEECVVLPQYEVYHADEKRSIEALRWIKKEFEEVVSIVARKHNFTIIRIFYTEPNEYRDPVSGCVSYSLRGVSGIKHTSAR